ncbi:MAG: D-aminoacyl-tRNA deacylase [bacterium]|jgi:D-tyrosyl-tRNA(Tyr) deacylase
MSTSKKAVYFFAVNPDTDPVAGHVFAALPEMYSLVETKIIIDDNPVLKHTDDNGNELYFVRTSKVVCHDYRHYLPIMNRYFSAFDMAGLVTWHEGQNAPDRIFSVHTTGDVDTGYFGNADPAYMHNLLLSLEKNRIAAGLEDFRITTEATHWSGMIYNGGTPDMIPHFPVPLFDIEIGSTPSSWSDSSAATVIAHALADVFNGSGKTLQNLLCVGGVHFEPAFAGAVLQSWEGNAFGISHIIPNHWLVTGRYEGEDGQAKLENCLRSINGGIAGIVFHDNLKGVYKEQLRRLGKKYSIPVFKHQWLRRPLDIPWNE